MEISLFSSEGEPEDPLRVLPSWWEDLAAKATTAVANKVFSCRSFIEYIEGKLSEVKESKYLVNLLDRSFSLDSIRQLLPVKNSPLMANYASELAKRKPEGPFHDVPLLGYSDQSTIHYHCGIYKSFASITEDGFCLRDTLERQFAIQPHLIHSNRFLSGLFCVGLEKIKTNIEKMPVAKLLVPALVGPGVVLQFSKMQESMDYEVAVLTQIADQILQTGNPKLKQVHVTFSNGGHVFQEALKQLSTKQRETILVIAVGTTVVIDSALACKVYNIIGDQDWLSQICTQGSLGADVQIISQNSRPLPIGGHYFIEKEYQERILAIIQQELVNRYEIY